MHLYAFGVYKMTLGMHDMGLLQITDIFKLILADTDIFTTPGQTFWFVFNINLIVRIK